jgi:hypothetical protein
MKCTLTGDFATTYKGPSVKNDVGKPFHFSQYVPWVSAAIGARLFGAGDYVGALIGAYDADL